MKFGYTIIRNDEEIDLTVEGEFEKGCRGSTDGRFGPKLEPDEPESFDISSVKYEDGKEVDGLTNDEYEDITKTGLEKCYEQMECQYDDMSDEAYEDWLDK